MMHTDTAAEPSNSMLTVRLIAACRDPRHHCAVVLAANAGLVACAAAGPFTPALVLHLVLLPVNAWRLLQALRSGTSLRPPANHRAVNPRRPAFKAMATAPTIRLPPRSAVN